MKEAKGLLKLAAVASSVLLMAGFVCYRAGAFHRLWESGAPADIASDPASDQGPLDAAPAGGTTVNGPGGGPIPDPALFYGSKSSIVFPKPTAAQQSPSGTAPSPPTILGGSKSVAPLIVSPPASTSGQQQAPGAAPTRPTILDGSKSGTIVPPRVIP